MHTLSVASALTLFTLLTSATDPLEGELEHIQERLDGEDLRGIPVLVVEGYHLLRIEANQ